MKKVINRNLAKYRPGALLLIGVLTATLMHTTTFMSQFFGGSPVFGFFAAFMLSVAILAMAILKDELVRDGKYAWKVRIVTSIFLFALGLVAVSKGFKSACGIELTWGSLMSLDLLSMIMWTTGIIIAPISYVVCDMFGTRNLIKLRDLMNRVGIFRRTYTTQPVQVIADKFQVSTDWVNWCLADLGIGFTDNEINSVMSQLRRQRTDVTPTTVYNNLSYLVKSKGFTVNFNQRDIKKYLEKKKTSNLRNY